MKTTLLILTLALSLHGCKKCVNCTQVTTTKTGNQPPVVYSQTSYSFCGTSSEISAQEGTATANVQQGGISVVGETKTTCR